MQGDNDASGDHAPDKALNPPARLSHSLVGQPRVPSVARRSVLPRRNCCSDVSISGKQIERDTDRQTLATDSMSH